MVCTKLLFSNSASALLAASITDVELSIQVDAGFGATFPNPGADEYFIVALENNAGDIEYCKVTARATDLFTVVRGFDGSVAQAWTNGVTRVELRNTKHSMERFVQVGGDTMECDLDMDGNEIIDAVLTGDTVIEAGAIIKGATITNADGDLCNAITIPDDCSPPLVGGSPLLTVNSFDPNSVFAAGMILMFYGDLADVPTGWALCDGNNGRPDLRNKFIVGVGSDFDFNEVGGTATHAASVTGSGGGHSHGGVTGATALAEADIPTHNHELWVYTGGHSSDVDGFSASGDAQGIAGQASGPHAYKELGQIGNQLVKDAGAGGGGGHTHTVTAESDHTHTVAGHDNLPPFHALYFIIKVDPAGEYGGAGAGMYNPNDMYDMYDESGCTVYIGGRSTQQSTIVPNYDGDIQLECCASNVFRIALSGNVHFLQPNNPFSGQVINIILKQTTGGHLATFDPVFKFPDGTAPILSAGASARDMLTAQYDSTDGVWLASVSLTYA